MPLPNSLGDFMNSYKKVVILILVTFVLPFANADILPSDCGHLTDWQYEECVNLLSDTSLNQEQKEDLYLHLIQSQDKLSSYYFIGEWNNNLEFNEPANETQSSGIIKDSWIKIISVNKSYFDSEKENWFVQNSGDVLTRKGYEIVLPSGTESGDCRTDYSYTIENENLRTELNNALIGNEEINSYTINTDDKTELTFYSEFFLSAELKIDHYKKIEQCGYIGMIWTCITLCLYDNSEFRHYSTEVSDEFKANSEVQEISTEIFLEKNAGINRLIIETESNYPINDFELKLGENTFSFSESNFDLGFTENGIIYAEKINSFTKKLRGFVELESDGKIELGTTETGECTYELVSDFEKVSLDCSLKELAETKLEIKTDSESFDISETMSAEVSLTDDLGNPMTNKKIILNAGNEKIELITNDEGKADAEIPAYSVLTAKFENDSEFKSAQAVKRITLTDEQSAETAEQVAIFAGAYYFIFIITKKFILGV